MTPYNPDRNDMAFNGTPDIDFEPIGHDEYDPDIETDELIQFTKLQINSK